MSYSATSSTKQHDDKPRRPAAPSLFAPSTKLPELAANTKASRQTTSMPVRR